MTRTGKIARLPQLIREQLNRRLQDGEPGTRLVEWVNALSDVQRVLAAEFDGRPVSEQNLSEWKQGGYRDWERHQESLALVRELTRQTDELADEADGLEVSHRLAAVLAVELAQVTRALLGEQTDPRERWGQLRESLRELAQLRQEDRKAGWLALERARRAQQEEQRLEEEHRLAMQRDKRQILAPIWAKSQLDVVAQIFGGGEDGRKVAAFILEVQRDLPLGSLTGKQRPPAAPEVPGGPTGSDPIQPNQTNGSPAP